MKQLLLSLIIVIGAMMTSCKKEGTLPITPILPGNGGGKVPVAPTTLVLSTNTNPILHNASITITAMTDGDTIKTGEQVILPGGSITFPGLKNDTTIYFYATKSNSYGRSEPKMAFILVKVWSQKTSQFGTYLPLHVTIARSCTAGNENSPNPDWLPGSIDCNLYQFSCNNTSQAIVNGFCNPSSTTVATDVWVWINGEAGIRFSGFDEWTITLYPNGFLRHRIQTGRYMEQFFSQ